MSPRLQSCLDCGAISDQNRCPKHRKANRRRRKEEGLTGARGSTRQSRKQRAAVLARDKDCVYCGASAEVVDHYMPKALGGSDGEANLVGACTECNSRKSDQHPRVFLRSSWLAERRRAVAEGGLTITGAGSPDTAMAICAKKSEIR
jgi:5-methylcytosine-specific restriction endonuclease McrA